MQNDYFAFILAAYAVSALAVGGLGLWVFFDARGRRADLAALEASGVRRRSARDGGA
ncbi:heme exporter protein CcmD [Aureimonas sp. SA4125]|uniref:heme exporter protein CcmD n=1 Tax=Aureimonas sp. SA4125 TaxID=2826993 RepID=UPI001CC6D9F4|nr:heme exporter protein CcmD [Aureimonas sp. SA4125]